MGLRLNITKNYNYVKNAKNTISTIYVSYSISNQILLLIIIVIIFIVFNNIVIKN